MSAVEEAIWVLLSVAGQRYTTHVRFAPGAMSEADARARARFHAWLTIAAPLLIPYSLVQVVDSHRK